MRFEDEIPPIDHNRLRWDSAPKSLLGQGSFGIVYKGKWNGTPVAIKVVKPARPDTHSEEYAIAESAALKQHRREIHRLMVVHNPFIIQYLGVFRGPNPRDLYIVTEFLEGGSLFDSLTKMRARQALIHHRSFLQLASHMAYGLCHVHSQQYTHGDMKPQNVLLTAAFSFDETSPSRIIAVVPTTAKAKIADFGLSKRLKGAGPTGFVDSTAATSDFGNGPCGTFLYMSPEAYDGVSHLTDDQAKAADVYAYGLILFELLSGVQSWEVENARNPVQLGMWVRRGQRPSWGEKKNMVRNEFSSLVERCWSQDPRDRPTFDEIVDELEVLEGKLDDSGWLPSYDHFSNAEAAENAAQSGKFEEHHVEADHGDASQSQTDPNRNPAPPVHEIPFLSDSFFAGIGSEASSAPTIRRVFSMRLADTDTANAPNQSPLEAVPLMHRSGFDESYGPKKVAGSEEPHSLSQVHQSNATVWPDGTGYFYKNSMGLVDQQGEIDGSVIAGVPVKRVQSTYNVSTPEIEPLHISANNGPRPTMGLGSFADDQLRHKNPRRSDGDLLNSFYGAGLDPFYAPARAEVGTLDNGHLREIPALQAGTASAAPPAASSNSKVQPGTGPLPSRSVFVHEAGAVDGRSFSGRAAQKPDHVTPSLHLPQASCASAMQGIPHYGGNLPILATSNPKSAATINNGVPGGGGLGTRVPGLALSPQSTLGSAIGPSVPQTLPMASSEKPHGISMNPGREALQETGADFGDSDLAKCRPTPYGPWPLRAGYMPMKTSPLSPELMDMNAVRLALQRPNGQDHIMRLWGHGHLQTVAGGLARAGNLRGGDILKLACDFLNQSTQLPPDKLEPVVSRDLCTCIGTIARNDSDTLCPSIALMAVRVALSTMFTHHATFLQNDKSSVEAYVACNFALCNLFRVHNVISDASFRADIAEWISFAISWNVHGGSPQALYSEALGYAATSAARNFIWMNKDNLTAFTSQGRRGDRRPASPLLWSLTYFDWVGSAPVVETSLSALAMIIHEPKQRECFTRPDSLKTLTDVLAKHKTNLRVTKLVFAAIAMLFYEMRNGGDDIRAIRKGFLYYDGCQRLVSALNEVKDILVDPRLVVSTLQAGFDALHATATLSEELRARVALCGAVTSMKSISTWLLSFEMQHFRDPKDSEMYFVFRKLSKSMFTLAREISEDISCAQLLQTSGALACLEELNHLIDNR